MDGIAVLRVLLGGLIILVAGSPAWGETPPAQALDLRDLAGVWAGQRDFGPAVRGTLTLSRGADGWSAEIAGLRLPVTANGETLELEVPGDGGRFRGRIHAESAVIDGQWIQPGTVQGFGQRFSTPVRLEPAGPGLWRGMVTPLADRVHIYFVLETAGKGRLRGFLRNPEANFGRHFEFRAIERDGSLIRFGGNRAGRRDAPEQVFMEGRYRDDPETISVFVESLGGTYDLRRRAAAEISGFLPRAWQREPYRYRPPLQRQDGWRTGDLEDARMAVGPIEALVRTIVATPIDAIDAPAIDAVLVARHGRLVLEEYFHGWGPDQPHDVRSASKSLTATLVGVAVRAGILSLDAKVYDVLSAEAGPRVPDSRASAMTIEHLLTMSSGLACDDWDAGSPGGEDRMQSQDEQPDWLRYTLSLPMAHAPGQLAAYCSGGLNLAGAMVARASGMPLTEYFDRYLARPLQIGVYHTNLMPSGEAYAGGGLRITGRDFLKLGQLMLDDGVWNGHRLLDAGWSERATRVRFELGNEKLGAYAGGWWVLEYQLEGHRWQAFYAGGNGGNYIIVVPELGLDIVFLASNYSQSVMHRWKLEYVPQYILRSAVEGWLRERQSASP